MPYAAEAKERPKCFAFNDWLLLKVVERPSTALLKL